MFLFLVVLREDCAEPGTGGIGLHYKGSSEVKADKHWGLSERFKGFHGWLIPLQGVGTSFGREWRGHSCNIWYEVTVMVHVTEELPKLLLGVWLAGFGDGIDLPLLWP